MSLYLKRILGSVDTEKEPEWEKELPVNLRCFEGVEWDDVQVRRGDWKNYGKLYAVPE